MGTSLCPHGRQGPEAALCQSASTLLVYESRIRHSWHMLGRDTCHSV